MLVRSLFTLFFLRTTQILIIERFSYFSKKGIGTYRNKIPK